MSSIFEETPAERAKRYLLLADAARRRADRATAPDVKANYLRLAQEWEALALQVERQINGADPRDGSVHRTGPGQEAS